MQKLLGGKTLLLRQGLSSAKKWATPKENTVRSTAGKELPEGSKIFGILFDHTLHCSQWNIASTGVRGGGGTKICGARLALVVKRRNLIRTVRGPGKGEIPRRRNSTNKNLSLGGGNKRKIIKFVEGGEIHLGKGFNAQFGDRVKSIEMCF